MKVSDIEFSSADHVISEVRNMNVKGGSPFGRAAAWAYKLACEQEPLPSGEALQARIEQIGSALAALKPTMATIHNTGMLVQKLLRAQQDAPLQRKKDEICALSERVIEQSLRAVETLGEYGAALIDDGAVVMMHSYSSTLMSVFEKAAAAGKKFRVISTESRPLRESRLAVRILQSCHVPVTYITDAEIWEFLPEATLVIMGADSIAWDGSVSNKMGTAMIAQLAQVCKKPVYIASELFKLDTRTRFGYNIVLERRTSDEILSPGDLQSTNGVDVVNQFFDLTPANQIRGLITEFGVISPAMVSLYWERLEQELLNA